MRPRSVGQKTLAAMVLLGVLGPASAAEPLKLHPENPRYFTFRGKPTFLITSGEHYGAVLNRDFDFIPYLDELKARGFNLTRTFSGTYREVPGSFNIESNTLAPEPGKYVAPWARSKTPGAADGGNKFDLDQWEPAYFDRLSRFVSEAGARGIVVEYVLFCPFYEDNLWAVNPMNAANNVNGVGKVGREEVYTLKHPAILERHLAFVREAVETLHGFDNVYFEICNEPYFGGVTLDWQARVARTIAEEETRLGGAPHLIAQNIANDKAKVETPDPRVSLFNFHYATPPEVIAMNPGLQKAFGDDETGFRGTDDRHYRVEGWEFLLAGGSLYSNLDYSFTTAHPDGTAKVVKPTPGGGGVVLRKQLSILNDFLAGFDFVRMVPDASVVVGGVPPKARAHCLAEKGKAYAVYLNGGTKAELVLEIPKGRYRVEWVNTRTGAVDREQTLDHPGGRAKVASPEYDGDVGLRVTSTD